MRGSREFIIVGSNNAFLMYSRISANAKKDVIQQV